MIVIGAIVLAVVMLAIVMMLLLKRQIREKYAVLWLLVGLIVLILGIFPSVLDWMTQAAGVQLPSNLLFAVAIVLLLGVTLHLSWELSQAEDEIRRNAEENAITRTNLDTLEKRINQHHPPTPFQPDSAS